MKCSAYPLYKPTGIEWLGDVPEHWGVTRLKNVIKGGLANGIFKTKEHFGSGTRLINVYDAYRKDFLVDEESLERVEATSSELNTYRVLHGDIFLVRSSLKVEGVGRAVCCLAPAEDIVFECHLVRARPRVERITPVFLIAFLNSSFGTHWLISQANTVTMATLGQTKIMDLPVLVPPMVEQRAIVDFLDRETEKLDTLVQKKRALIEKLKEKRTALISRTVTRGLPPDAARAAGLNPHPKLNPSGIEWLGDVPEHWDTPPLYTRYSIELGKMLDESRITGKHLIQYLRNIDVQWDRINIDDLPEMDFHAHEYERYTLKQGDLLVCEGGEVGRAAIFKNNGAVIGFQKALHRLRPARANENPRFMFYTLYWASNLGVFLAEGNPNTIPHLTGEKLRRYRFPKPPVDEQRAIADFLDRETANIDRMVAKVEAAIERLQEYRTALITAAVTGKIDVRSERVDNRAVFP